MQKVRCIRQRWVKAVTFCSLHHGVRNNPLQAESVSHDEYLAIWYGVSVNRTNEGYCSCWDGVSERNDRNECEEKRREEKETMTTFYTQQSGFGLRTCLAFVYIS